MSRFLVNCPHNLPVATLQCDQADVVAMLEMAFIVDLFWHGNYNALFQQCANMLHEWGSRPFRCSDDVSVFGSKL